VNGRAADDGCGCCAHCVDHFIGTLACSREWFAVHVGSEPVAPSVEPAPAAYAERVAQSQRRPMLVPRSGVALAVA